MYSNAYAFTSIGTKIIVSISDQIGIYSSTDYGENWDWANINIHEYPRIQSLVKKGTNIYAGSYYYGIYLSTNNGDTWVIVNNGLTNLSISSFAVSGEKVFAATFGGGVFLFSDSSQSWTAINNGLTSLYIYGLCAIDSNVFAGTQGGLYRSTNYGGNWAPDSYGLPNLQYMPVHCFFSTGTYLFAGTSTNYYVIRSTNCGGNWTLANSGIIYDGNTFSLKDTNLFAGTYGGVFLSTNNGNNWLQKNQGLGLWEIFSLITVDNFIFAGTASHSVWRRDLNEILTLVQNSSNPVPEKYTLSQNYPNPFNPSTNIRYEIPKNEFVKLIVFDALGREVETLVNEKQNSGTYEATFDASQYSSGVYFYRLTTDNFSDTKKMLLIK
jgi:photosystem II stability/assembly factor-like uncharacterized protein